ncbi:hypothetical protein AB0I68_38025 [Streptomyces sp. NPDC050448]|uniref:hypothetical protein n=1 Tax=Streptomyces sp. NPDC050448 TaxID=3155404 RepID=UPI0034402296
MTTRRTTRIRTMALAGVLAAATLSAIGTASAEGNPVGQDNAGTLQSMQKCADQSEEFRFRFYYNSNTQGAWVNIGHDVYDLARISMGGSSNEEYALQFCDKGNGAYVNVANHAASAYNWYRGYCATVHYNSGFRGATDRIYPNNSANLGATKNNNKSIDFDAC